MAVLAISISITNKKIKEELEQIPCIWYPVTFKDQIEALLDSRSKVNIMSQIFAQQLNLKTNIKAQKIDSTILKTYKMVVSTFFVLDKDNKERFFEESFLLADIRLNIMLGIFFLIIGNADVNFQAQDLQ